MHIALYQTSVLCPHYVGPDGRQCSLGEEVQVIDVKKVSRMLLDLKATESYLRQYPQVAARLAAALEKATGKKR